MMLRAHNAIQNESENTVSVHSNHKSLTSNNENLVTKNGPKKQRRALGDITNKGKQRTDEGKNKLGAVIKPGLKINVQVEKASEYGDVEYIHGEGMTGKFDGGIDLTHAKELVLSKKYMVNSAPFANSSPATPRIALEKMEYSMDGAENEKEASDEDWLDLNDEDLDIDLDF